MRGYQEGDDLRRIHWPSVARTGDLMIRQDEASRRASGLIYLDSRGSMLGSGFDTAAAMVEPLARAGLHVL